MKTEISTKTATTTTAANSEGNISVEEGGDTGIKIFKGSAEVATTAGDKVTLQENEALKVDAKGKAGKKTVLPTPPQTVAPPALAELALQEGARHHRPPRVEAGDRRRHLPRGHGLQRGPGRPASLRRPRPARHPDEPPRAQGARPGQVLLARGGGERGRRRRQVLEGHELRGRAAARSPPSPPRPPPQVRIDPLESMGPVVALRGRAAPGSTVSVDGVDIPVQPDGSFSEFLKRGDRRELTIKVTGPGGEVTEEKRPVS